MSLSFLLLFGLTVFLASIIPGPSMLLALTHGMQYGAKRTMASAMGNLTITLVQASISIVGLGAVLIASETVFHTIKWAGAAYLIYMGVCLVRSPGIALPVNATGHSGQKISLTRMYLQAALVTAGNPKAIVFFTAVFPQFINPEAAFIGQSCLLLGLGAVIAFGCFMLYAIGGEKLASMFSQAAMGKRIAQVIGCTFIGAGLGLAVSRR